MSEIKQYGDHDRPKAEVRITHTFEEEIHPPDFEDPEDNLAIERRYERGDAFAWFCMVTKAEVFFMGYRFEGAASLGGCSLAPGEGAERAIELWGEDNAHEAALDLDRQLQRAAERGDYAERVREILGDGETKSCKPLESE